LKLFQLLPLQCKRCGAPITSGRSDMVYFCMNCGAGLEFNGTNLEIIETVFAKPLLDKEKEPELFLPFWYFHLDIRIKGKEAYLPLLFTADFIRPEEGLFTDETLIEEILRKRKQKDKKEDLDFSIYVPSFPTTGIFEYSSNIGNRFTKAQPHLTYHEENRNMESCIYNSTDALAIAEDEYISLQSSVVPNLLALDLSFNLKQKKIIGIPYVRKEKGIFYDQIIGEIILSSALKLAKYEEK